jgi:LAS superfamily LD-carboxypeptidase LdcB
MVLNRTASQLFVLSLCFTFLGHAQSAASETSPEVTQEEALPNSPARSVSSAILAEQLKAFHREAMLAGCKVAPLSEIEDPEVLMFENNAETAPADVEGLRPDAAQALDTFKGMVTSLGGVFELKSAYRPVAYQAHLHEVWVKWMKELRNNRSSGCRALREEVGAEFARHKLLVRQQPVPASDHALGLAFDAAVAMPRAARLDGKRVTVDKLAAMVGMKRPNSRRDPVHFKLLAERPPVAVSDVRSSTLF